MKLKKSLTCILVLLAFCVTSLTINANFKAKAASTDYLEEYRPQLSYTPKNNWNNDPNGLVYALGVYHMYYQYSTSGNTWDTMHWGHSTSTDLVHWEEQPVAINPNMPGWGNYDSTAPNGPIFSGSAVYVSQSDIDSGKVSAYNGAGFYAIFTQPNQTPNQGVGDQRQSIAYSSDGTNYAFSTFKEIIPNDYDDGSGVTRRGDFRDPKVFYDDLTSKWVMIVGGGEIVQFQSDDLSQWDYVGTTTLWGECPDMFKLSTKDGEEKWIMVLSPEDKPQSHEYNNTDRTTTEYPNEFYVIGTRDANGLFVADEGETVKPLSIGIDSYAIQTFNGVADRRVGISWSASWKTVGDYANKASGGLRDNWNGGMTLAYELGLKKVDGEFLVTKNPVSEYQNLRANNLFKQQVTVNSENSLNGVNSNLAEINVEFDCADTSATMATLSLAVSKYEHTDIKYDFVNQILSIDRSNSSLSAKDTSRYSVVYSGSLKPEGGKVKLKVYLDHGFIHVFGGDGEVSASVAIFPSLASNGISLTADADIAANVDIYALDSIWNNSTAAEKFNSFYISAKEEILNIGDSLHVLVGSPNPSFNPQNVSYSITEGEDIIDLSLEDGVSLIAKKQGTAVVKASYGGVSKNIFITVHKQNISSDLGFSSSYAGAWHKADGFVGISGGDGFIFSDTVLSNFKLSANLTAGANSQAAGIVFAASDNFHTFYCANYDYKEKSVKLWMSGGDTIASASLNLRRGEPLKMDVTVYNGEITIGINGDTLIKTSHSLYEQGRIGLNVYNGTFNFNNITLSRFFSKDDGVNVTVDGDFIVRNNTDSVYLDPSQYSADGGNLAINESYLLSLKANTLYNFSIKTASGKNTEFFYQTATGVSVMESYKLVSGGDLSVTVSGAKILDVTLGDKSVDYKYERGRVIVDESLISLLSDGDYTLKIYTDGGLVEYTFGYKFLPPPKINRAGMIISVIAACLVIAAFAGFVVYWIISGRKKVKA